VCVCGVSPTPEQFDCPDFKPSQSSYFCCGKPLACSGWAFPVVVFCLLFRWRWSGSTISMVGSNGTRAGHAVTYVPINCFFVKYCTRFKMVCVCCVCLCAYVCVVCVVRVCVVRVVCVCVLRVFSVCVCCNGALCAICRVYCCVVCIVCVYVCVIACVLCLLCVCRVCCVRTML